MFHCCPEEIMAITAILPGMAFVWAHIRARWPRKTKCTHDHGGNNDNENEL